MIAPPHLRHVAARLAGGTREELSADADALLSRAEVAMYAAKRRTAGAQVYDPAVDTASALNLSLLSELRHQLRNSSSASASMTEATIKQARGVILGKTSEEIVVRLNAWARETMAKLRKMKRGPYIFHGVKDAKKAYQIASAASGQAVAACWPIVP